MTGTRDGGLREDLSGQIAVIGMACRFPGAADYTAFWRNLTGGVDSVTRFPPRPLPNGGKYVPARGLLDDPEYFDAGYFGYSPREARTISPQHRVFLECAAQALDDAGHDPARYAGAIGVYAGGAETSYAQTLRSQRAALPALTDWEILLATGTDFLASRVAYKLGLRGPAVVVQAACATSLVAVHAAIAALLSGDCDLALAGGVAVHVPAKDSQFVAGGIISASGICATFDAAADGTVGADGAGVVVLKRLTEALADRDHVHAVIRGSAVNNDGSRRVGFTAPSVDGQAAVVRDAQFAAGVDAGTITYLEAHGTATPMGDPIELAALTKAFRQDTDAREFCWIGSVKTNIGHTDTAAGAAGLVKAVMAIEHAVIPPTLHFNAPNPQIDFAASPFRVATEVQPWQTEGIPRRAGVSAFGIGGANAHVVLEQAPAVSPPGPPERAWHVVTLSARSAPNLDLVTGRLAAHLRAHPELSIADVAWTLQVGRGEHGSRRYAVVTDIEDCLRTVTGENPERLITSSDRPRPRSVAFVFPGGPGRGSAVGRADGPAGGGDHRETGQLYRTEPEFRRVIDECRDAAAPDPAARVLVLLGTGDTAADPATADLVAFAEEYALARLWIHWGVKPTAVLGTGIGALVAATVAGVLRVSEVVGLIQGWAAGRSGDLVDIVQPRPAGMPVLSDLTGDLLSAAELGDPAYWAGRARAGVDLERGLSTLLADPDRIVVEVGVGRRLTTQTQALPGYTDGHLALATLTGTTGAPSSMPDTLGRLWLAGTPISWAAVHDGHGPGRIPLPTYPFERQRYIVEADASTDQAPTSAAQPPSGAPQRSEQRDSDAAPQVDTATVVTRLFAEILELPEVDLDDSFFDLGGDSLMAVHLLDEVERVFAVDPGLRSLFDAPTATSFAALIDARLAGEAADPQPTS